MTTTATPLSIYQLRIALRGISPLIWRRVLVHRETILAQLHTILQVVFAWSDAHLHSFHIHGREYGSSGASTHDIRLYDLCLHRGERFRYVYDFGVYWECDIRLEALLPRTSQQVYPIVQVASVRHRLRTVGAPGGTWPKTNTRVTSRKVTVHGCDWHQCQIGFPIL
jgi:hypothetical protein